MEVSVRIDAPSLSALGTDLANLHPGHLFYSLWVWFPQSCISKKAASGLELESPDPGTSLPLCHLPLLCTSVYITELIAILYSRSVPKALNKHLNM